MHECNQEAKIDKILDRVGSLEESRARMDVLTETFIETTRDLSNTMKQVEKTMIKMQSSLENNETKISDLSTKVDELKVAEDKNKIDIRDIMKSNILKGGVGIAGLYGVYELIMKIVEK